jgi:hypothetical protein
MISEFPDGEDAEYIRSTYDLRGIVIISFKETMTSITCVGATDDDQLGAEYMSKLISLQMEPGGSLSVESLQSFVRSHK